MKITAESPAVKAAAKKLRLQCLQSSHKRIKPRIQRCKVYRFPDVIERHGCKRVVASPS